MNGLIRRTETRVLFFGVVVLLLLPVYLLVCPSQVSATLLTYTDTTYAPSLGGLNPITYSLEYEWDSINSEYDATLTIATSDHGVSSAPDWRLGWVDFKFGPAGSSFTIDKLSSPSGWAVGDSTTTFGVGAPTPFATQFAGFYATDLSGDGLTGGLSLTGGATTYTFGFSFRGTGAVFEDAMPFKAGFFDGEAGKSGHARFDQLSESAAVPEPASMLLLGTGLVGLAGFGRKKLVKK